MFRYRTIIVSSLMLIGTACRVFADDVPTLNVQTVCRGIAQQSASPAEKGAPDLSLDRCIKSEQAVREQLVKEWATFAPADKASCTRSDRAGGEPSYTDLLTCLEMARDVRKLNSPAQPKRID